MTTKQQYGHRNTAVIIIAVFIMLIAISFCFLMVGGVSRRMNESATSNLFNTTQMIENTLEDYIRQDFESLSVIGRFYENGDAPEKLRMTMLQDALGFEWIGVVDAQGNGAGCYSGEFRASDLCCHDQWVPGTQGYSDAYLGESGRLETMLWIPVYRDGAYIGTVFGEVILSRYYSAEVFTFYSGEGRTYLFDGSDGKWILRSLGYDGVSRRQEDIYSLLRSSQNSEADIEVLRQAIDSQKTGTAILNFNGKRSYICFTPLPSSPDWYLATVIAADVLLRESAQVRRTIQLTLAVSCMAILFFTVTFSVWRIRKTKEREADYREALFLNVSSNIDSAFLIYEKAARQTVFVSENVKRLLCLERDWLQADAGRLFDWCGIEAADPERTAFLSGTMGQPAVREVCVENELGAKARYIRLELIPADLGQEIAVLTDITRDKDVQKSLLEAMQRAEAASHAKNDFLSAMSHDIRTPMNGIVGMTAIAASHLEDRRRVQDCLTKINEASAHLLTIINEILDMSQIESGKIELAHDPFNLAELLQEVLNINYPGIQQKNQTIHVHIHPMEHEQVIGDPARLQRVVTNLISNAIKYTPEGGSITLTLQEIQPVIKAYGCYELMVQDNGIGMSREFQKKLFQPFEREEDARISRIQGTGLGMSIVKNIVSLMMGDIQVESEKHRGTTFRVRLNLRLDEQKDAPEAALASLPVLVVDDDRVTCETVTSMLCDIGMAGEWVDNGREAVERVAQRHLRRDDFMAVILDWKMPEMDGVETARQIRATVDANLPIIILTAYDWSEIEADAREAGVSAFISKPIYKAKLRRKMTEIAAGSVEMPGMTVLDDGMIQGKRVLLVEDNDLNLEIAMEFLRMLKIRVDCARDGMMAVEYFSASAPGTYDMILMDIQMPRMNGYEACRAIRRMERPDAASIPIVAMTADTFAKDVQCAYTAGMNEHLAKPVSVEGLIKVLTRFLGNPEAESEEEVAGNGAIY